MTINELTQENKVINLNGELITSQYEVFKDLINSLDVDKNSFWKKQEEWAVSKTYVSRFNAQKKYLDEFFIPYLNKTDIIADIASATGEFSFYLSDKVQKIVAYELSENMVNFSKKQAADKNIVNVDFIQGDILEVPIEKNFDAAMMMGLFTYIMEDQVAEAIINKVSSSLKNGAKLVVKDSLTCASETQYLPVPSNAYNACYRTKEKYVELYKKCGFKLVSETVLDKVDKLDGFISIGLVFEKNKSTYEMVNE